MKRIALFLALIMLLSVCAMPICANETVTITFDLNGGTSADTLQIVIPKGSAVPQSKYPEAEYEGKAFFGWFTRTKAIDVKARVSDAMKFDEDTTVYAVWDEVIERREDIPTMTYNKLDKAYISFIFDDNNTDLPKIYELITGEYNYPVCAAIPASKVVGGTNLDMLLDMQAHGGEVLSHGYNHRVLNRGVLWSIAEDELKRSKEKLTELGFNVNGVVTVGGGGTEDQTIPYKTELQGITSKYYNYGSYGSNLQYMKTRFGIYDYSTASAKPVEVVKKEIDRMIANKEWVSFFAHNTREWPLDHMREILEYVKEKEKAGLIEVITYKTAFETLATWDREMDFGDTTYTADFHYPTGIKLGASVTVKGNTPELPEMILPKGKKLTGWSTEIYGEGDMLPADLSGFALDNNIKLYAVLEEAPAEETKLPFEDVAEDAWYYDDLKYAYENKLFNGVSDTRFAPDTTLNRAMFVTVLHRMNFEPEANKKVKFKDVPDDAYYTKAVAWANEQGIVGGVTSTSFAPENVITREQLATILFRYVTSAGMDHMTLEDNLSGISDHDKISEYAVTAMNWAVGKGILIEREDRSIDPQAGATRAEAATALVRMLATFG